MRARVFTASIAIALATALAGMAALAQSTLVLPNSGFSIAFPAPPEEKTVDTKGEGEPVTGKVWSVRAGDVVFFADYVDYTHDVDAKGELALNAKNFAGSFKGKVISSKPRRFKRPAGPMLPGIEFTFDAPTVAGAGLSLVEGRRSCVVAAVSIKPHDGTAEIERFLKSFRLTKR